jgi:hypothetical protein
MKQVNGVYVEDPFHEWFELSYSAYLVLPRVALTSMPIDWQEKMIGLLDEMRESLPEPLPEGATHYWVRAAGPRGVFVKDPLVQYRHHPGLPLKEVCR